jgi:hypothetical protein
MTLSACIVEQRREIREPARGEVWFALEGGGKSIEFQGSLVDCSKNGFRASHPHTSLSTGQQVRFRHSRGQGRAVVMWNRILERSVESGFLILEIQDEEQPK